MAYTVSLATIVIHSWDNKGIGMAHEIKPPKKSASISQMSMGQLIHTSFQFFFKNLLQNVKKNYLMEFSTDWLMLSDKLNSITELMLWAWFFTGRCCFSQRCAFWHTTVRTIHSSWCPPLCSIHLCWQLKESIWWLHRMASTARIMEILRIFIVAILITEVLFG